MKTYRKLTWLLSWIIKLYIISEMITLYTLEFYFRGQYKVRQYLANLEPPIHSVYLSEPLWTPQYTLMHRPENPKIKIYTANQNPMFFRQMTGWPLPSTQDSKLVFCTQLIDDLVQARIRPEYIVLDQFQCSNWNVKGNQCHMLCHHAILNVEHESVKLYSVVKKIDDIHVASEDDAEGVVTVINHPTYLYKLNDNFAPF
jgi:hypothetical protein